MKNENFEKIRNLIKNYFQDFCTCAPSGNQVDGLPLALSKDAESASWLRSGRACERKIYKKMYGVNENFNVELLVNHQNLISYYLKASKAASQS